MSIRILRSLLLLALLTITTLQAQSPRDHTRPKYSSGTTVSDSQAVDLTLTLSAASVRPVQTWVRTAGTIDKTGKVLTAYLSRSNAEFVKVGQRVRAFPPEAR